ncbi:MAG TPA: hypothetical protein PK370_02290 [Candidatus Woesebacteria bacterium]|nr:hypothetical protein [Candidatus Woesebacteria bacterium]HPJ17195.1 hypothetical protein [Candidatus Woesebacteria bacterium]
MILKEVKELLISSELSEPALNKAFGLLLAYENDSDEVSDEVINKIMLIMDKDIDTDKMTVGDEEIDDLVKES